MRLEDKDTSSGRDMRDYRCDACGEACVVNRGPALWQILSDARGSDT